MSVLGLYLVFPQGWLVLTAIFYGLWIVIGFQTRLFKKKGEIKKNMAMGLVALVLAVIVENIAIPARLWTYFPGNWPLILWINYFGSGLLGYQIVKKIEEVLGK